MEELDEFVPLTQVPCELDIPSCAVTQLTPTTETQRPSTQLGSTLDSSILKSSHPNVLRGDHEASSREEDSKKLTTPRPTKRKPFSFPRPAKQISKEHWTRTSYFTMRQKKLETQAPAAETDILAGTTVYFTGVKSASQRKLEGLVWRNGGTVQKVWLRRQVTHVIADNLAASKVEKELQLDVKRTAVVVKSTWITESLRRGEKLPTWDFRVVKAPPGVKDVASYFKFKKGTKNSTKSGK